MARHQSGSLKQSNKKHKGTASKRLLEREKGAGRVQSSTGQSAKMQDVKSASRNSRMNRLNHANQLKKQKKNEIFLQKRLGSTSGPPKIIGIVPLNSTVDTSVIIQQCIAQSSWCSLSDNEEYLPGTVVYANYAKYRSRFAFIECSCDVLSILDVARVSDVLILATALTSADQIADMIDEVGNNALTALRALGCPASICSVQNLASFRNPKQLNLIHRSVEANISAGIKVVDSSDHSQMCRLLSTVSNQQDISWRGIRSYVLADGIEVSTATDRVVKVSGYLRGKPLNVHSLMHIPGVGVARIASIEASVNGGPDRRGRLKGLSSSSSVSIPPSSVVMLAADESKQDSLDMYAHYDGISGEQTWPQEYEMNGNTVVLDGVQQGTGREAAGIDGRSRRHIPISIPQGMSSYQADWFLDEEGDFDKPTATGSSNILDGDAEAVSDDRWKECDEDDGLDDSMTVTGSVLDFDSPAKAKASLEDKRRRVLLAAEEDGDFPDEIDTPHDVSARDRFVRYRALQSFRSSPWHPKENLPIDYSKIYQFEDFAGTQRRILGEGRAIENMQNTAIFASQSSSSSAKGSSTGSKSAKAVTASTMAAMQVNEDDGSGYGDEFDNEKMIEDDSLSYEADVGSASLLSVSHSQSASSCIVPGAEDSVCSSSYIVITLDNVGDGILEKLKNGKLNGLLSLFSLLPHENKLSVLNFSIQRVNFGQNPNGYSAPIKAKEELIFMAGFRCFNAKPIFSEANLNCDKNKMDRFLLPDRFTVATVFAPVTYMPSPVLVFKREAETGRLILVATGTLAGVNPDRIVLKKIILTGLPIRVRKRFAVVKHMFYDPHDVRWFKPAELATKRGLRGHIKEPVGTHGLMKVLFSGPVTQNDTVMLTLFKRVFPKIPDQGINVM